MHLPDIDAASRALFRVGRSLAHRPAAPDVELSGIHVAQAVAEAREQGREATIADIATVLAVEHSTASRLVARARQAGLVLTARAASDGRARVLTLTPAGEALSQAAWQWQREVFLRLTADWNASERESFSRQFLRFAEALSCELENPALASGEPENA